MKYQEMLDIDTGINETANSYVPTLKQAGYQFEIVRDGLIRMFVEHQDYSPETYNDISRIIKAHNWDAHLRRQIRTQYDDQDYEIAAYYDLVLDTIDVDDDDRTAGRKHCDRCDKITFHPDYSICVPFVKSRKMIGEINFGGPTIMSEDAVDACLRAELTGLDVIPFDEEERYYYLTPKTNLGFLKKPPIELIDYRGVCPKCGFYQFEIAYGPFRLKDNFPHDDFVALQFLTPIVLFSKKATQVLQELDPSIEIFDPVFLED